MTVKGVTMKRTHTAMAVILLGASSAGLAHGQSSASNHGFSSTSPIEQGLPNAKAGDCFARVIIAATYDTIPQTVTTQDAFDTLEVTPAQLTPETLNIKTRDEGIRYVVRQPRYETITEEVLVRPAYEELSVVPAQFETVTETIAVGEPRKVWRKGRNLSAISRTDADGTVYCLVEEPAETRTISRRVVRVPERVQTVTIPAQYKTVTKQVLTDPGGVDQQPIAAEYTDVTVARLVSPATQFSQAQPAQTSTVDTRRLNSPERFEWVPVLCDTNASSVAMRSIQTALLERGHYSGTVDGISGVATQSALNSFQRANGISHEGFLSAYTLDLLGLGHLVSSTRQAAPVPGQRAVQHTATPVQQSSTQAAAPVAPPQTQFYNSPSESTVVRPRPETQVNDVQAASPRARQPYSHDRRLNWVGKR